MNFDNSSTSSSNGCSSSAATSKLVQLPSYSVLSAELLHLQQQQQQQQHQASLQSHQIFQSTTPATTIMTNYNAELALQVPNFADFIPSPSPPVPAPAPAPPPPCHHPLKPPPTNDIILPSTATTVAVVEDQSSTSSSSTTSHLQHMMPNEIKLEQQQLLNNLEETIKAVGTAAAAGCYDDDDQQQQLPSLPADPVISVDQKPIMLLSADELKSQLSQTSSFNNNSNSLPPLSSSSSTSTLALLLLSANNSSTTKETKDSAPHATTTNNNLILNHNNIKCSSSGGVGGAVTGTGSGGGGLSNNNHNNIIGSRNSAFLPYKPITVLTNLQRGNVKTLNKEVTHQTLTLHEKAARGDLRIEDLNGLEIIDIADNKGRTMLHWAAFHSRLETVQMLIEKGAAINCCTPRGETALMHAAANGHFEIINYLLTRQPPAAAAAAATMVDLEDENGNTALFFATIANHCPTVSALLKAGASLTKVNSNGDTPFSLAVSKHLLAAQYAMESYLRDFIETNYVIKSEQIN